MANIFLSDCFAVSHNLQLTPDGVPEVHLNFTGLGAEGVNMNGSSEGDVSESSMCDANPPSVGDANVPSIGDANVPTLPSDWNGS